MKMDQIRTRKLVFLLLLDKCIHSLTDSPSNSRANAALYCLQVKEKKDAR